MFDSYGIAGFYTIYANPFKMCIRDRGETHVLLGPNGAGKSTLFLTILGFPQYNVAVSYTHLGS